MALNSIPAGLAMINDDGQIYCRMGYRVCRLASKKGLYDLVGQFVTHLLAGYPRDFIMHEVTRSRS